MADLDRMYAERQQASVDRQRQLDRMAEEAARKCPRCAAHAAAVPTEVQLRQLVSDDEGLEQDAFIPRGNTGEQVTALAAYAHALTLMIKAFGLEIASARVRRSLAVLNSFARLARVFHRADEAKAPILADLRAKFDRGEIGGEQANAIFRDTPAPNYDGRDRDDAWLRKMTGEGVDAL